MATKVERTGQSAERKSNAEAGRGRNPRGERVWTCTATRVMSSSLAIGDCTPCCSTCQGTGTSAQVPHEERGSLVGGGGVDARRTRRKANVLVERRTRFVGGSDLDLHKEGAVRTALFRAVDCFSRGGGVRRGVSVRSVFRFDIAERPGSQQLEPREIIPRGTGGLTGGRVDVLPTVFASEDVVDLFPLQVRPLDILNVRKRSEINSCKRREREGEDGPVSRGGTRRDRWRTPTCCRSVLRPGRAGSRNTGSCRYVVVRR